MTDDFNNHGSTDDTGEKEQPVSRDEALVQADDIFGSAASESSAVSETKIPEAVAVAEEPTVVEAAVTEAAAEAVKPAKEASKAAVIEERPPTDPFRADMGWYVVHVYSGFEMKALRALEERIRTHNMQDQFGGTMVPQETVIELVRGQKKTLNKKFYPGYMLVQMMMNEDTWHLVKETPKVTGFVGDVKDPAPLLDEEVKRLIGQIEEGATSPRSRMSFEQGETIKVVDGPFADFSGTVEEVKPEKGKVKVLISIFGRATPVELDFVQIEKIA